MVRRCTHFAGPLCGMHCMVIVLQLTLVHAYRVYRPAQQAWRGLEIEIGAAALVRSPCNHACAGLLIPISPHCVIGPSYTQQNQYGGLKSRRLYLTHI